MSKNSAVNLDITNNADGFDITGGTTRRTFTYTGGNGTFSATGTNTYTFQNSSDTIVGRATTDTLTNKTLTNSNNTLGGVTMTLGSDATGDIYYRAATTGILTRLAIGASGTVLHGGTIPAYAAVTLTTDVTGVLPVANGGTGQSSYTDGQLLIGNTSGNTLTKATLTQGSGITITNGNGTITIASTASGFAPIPLTVVTGTTQAAAVNNAYATNNAGAVTVTIPSTAAVGDEVAVIGMGAGGWILAQNASQVIHFGNVNTTTGTGGSIASTNRYDNLYIKCLVANTEFTVTQAQGNMTVV